MSNNHPPEPTGDQCSKRERLPDFNGYPAYAIWYPQMGGYVSRAVVVLEEQINSEYGGCFGAFVWHDGEFPFRGDDGKPVYIHHCDPDQFIDFGQQVIDFQKQS